MNARDTLVRTLALAALAATIGCGGDDVPAPRPRPRADPSAAPATGTGPAPVATAPGLKATLTLYPKVDDKYRREFVKQDFQPDPEGDRNRDPFRAYFIDPAPGGGGVISTAPEMREDYCEKRMVAGNFGFNDLNLIGVLTGKKKGALFLDQQRFGHIAHLGDCLSKDKVRILKIEGSTVEVEIRGEPPPGGAAPPPRREVIRLHPEELEGSEFGNQDQ